MAGGWSSLSQQALGKRQESTLDRSLHTHTQTHIHTESMCMSCRAPGMQGVRGSEMFFENKTNFCSLCSWPGQQISLSDYLLCSYFKKIKIIIITLKIILWLLQKPLCSLFFQFLMFESMEGQLKVIAAMFDPQVVGRCVDVADRNCCRQALTVTFRWPKHRLQIWNLGTTVVTFAK